VVDADCHRKVPVRGRSEDEEVYVDPFDVMFEPPDYYQVVTWVIDMVDETIGVLHDSAASLAAFMESDQTKIPTTKAPAAYYGGSDVAVAPTAPSDLTVAVQQGRLELVDPPRASPVKLNRLREELPSKLAALTSALADLTEAVKNDNGFLGDLLKTQLVAMLKATVLELEAPQADTSRLQATARVLTGIAVEAGKRGGAEFIKGKLDAVSSALVEMVKWLWHPGQ
jgi:hypothetical protein